MLFRSIIKYLAIWTVPVKYGHVTAWDFVRRTKPAAPFSEFVGNE